MAAKTYTISENLELLAQNKQAIKNAIIAKGGTITDSTPLSQYATQIESLPSGGGSSTDYFVSGTSSANTFTLKVNNTNVTPTFTASGSGYTWKVDLNQYEVANLNLFANGNKAITSVDMSHAGNAVDMTNAFGSCSSLTAYTPNALDACIYTSQFQFSGLREYTIPSYCACIGNSAFSNCKAITSVDVPENAVMGEYCFKGAGLTEATMYDRYYIPVGTFQNCGSLVTIHLNVVEHVGNFAFVNCVNFQPEAGFFEQLFTIGESAFQGCTSLGELTFVNCESIGKNAFNGCTGLGEIRFSIGEDAEIPTLGEGAFDNTNDCPIYVPEGKISDFLAVDGWAAYESRLREPVTDWSQEYLTFLAVDDSCSFSNDCDMDYSLDGGETWQSLPAYEETPYVEPGNKIMFKATETGGRRIKFSSMSGRYKVMGNAYSMLFGDNFAEVSDLSGYDSVLYGLFQGNGNLISAKNLSLPATTLTDNCYNNMFRGCTSLTEAPALPATTLTDACYANMFQGCTSLNYVKMLATDVSAPACLDYWLDGVSPTGTFVKHPNANLPSGASGIPAGWTVETATE